MCPINTTKHALLFAINGPLAHESRIVFTT